MDVLTDIAQAEEALYVLIGIVGGAVGLKAATVARLKKTGKKAVQVVKNLDELTEHSLEEIVEAAVHNGLNGSLTDLQRDHKELKANVNALTQKVAELAESSDAVSAQLLNVGTELAHIRGRLEGGG